MASIKFKWRDDDYNPYNLRVNVDYGELVDEYERLRDIANRRLKRIGGSEFAEYDIYKKNVGRYPTVSNVGARRLPHLVSDLHRFLSSSQSTISGLKTSRAKAIETLASHGYHISESKYVEFGNFMKRARAVSAERMFDSERAAEIYEEYEELMSMDEMIEMYREEVCRNAERLKRIRELVFGG